MTNVLYIGNFNPQHSTENHIWRALRNNGHSVRAMQEDNPMHFNHLAHDPGAFEGVDLVLWTRTGWDWDRIYPGGEVKALNDQHLFLRRARAEAIPVVGYHLDIWWGLKRQHQLRTEPFFSADLVVTADGGHADDWVRAGITHHWMPPAVSEGEAKIGKKRKGYEADLAFVGSWQGGYHVESEHRYQLVDWLKRNFPTQCLFYPKPGEHAVRGKGLQDLYASTKLVIGDSCFAGTGLTNYWSDRIPETLGRGGLLAHPGVPGLEHYFDPGRDLLTWPAFDFDTLANIIDNVLNDEIDTHLIRNHGRETVLREHTYEVRMRQLWEELHVRGLL